MYIRKDNMKDVIYTVESNEQLTENIYKMKLAGDTSAITAPGQFINIKIESLFLRRPISVFDCEDGAVTIIYKVVGTGTEKMAQMTKGQKLDCLTGLGNGFNSELSGNSPVVIGGGVGVPPMYYLAKKLREQNKNVTAILGFNKESEIFGEEDFKSLGVKTVVTTVDGSAGIKGFVTDGMKDIDYTYITLQKHRVSSASRSGWAAASEPAWAVHAKQNTVTREYARKVPCL